MAFTRRDFISTAIAGSIALKAPAQQTSSDDSRKAQVRTATGKRPIMICAGNATNYLERGFTSLRGGADTLEAVLSVVSGPEDDPNDDSVGLGGLPNEEGVVELDACCMHGPTRRAGSVGGIHHTRHAARLSRDVMMHTGHVMLVGDGADRFADAMGFPRENLLTDRSRKIWLLWKEFHSNNDWWGPGLADPRMQVPKGGFDQAALWQDRFRKLEEMAADLGIEPEFRGSAIRRVLFPPTGTTHCSALNEKGEMSACTTTSGLSYKLPGRCGDSPIIGAGCYLDQDVGSAGATGSGEENIKIAGAHTIVENMRHGMSPEDAGMDALKRIVRNYNNDQTKLRYMDMTYYILRNDGVWAGVSLWEGYNEGNPHTIAVHDGAVQKVATRPLLKGYSQEFPPEIRVPEAFKNDPEYAK